VLANPQSVKTSLYVTFECALLALHQQSPGGLSAGTYTSVSQAQGIAIKPIDHDYGGQPDSASTISLAASLVIVALNEYVTQ
jgi:hypothetical protein